jgi:hypothetical protein
LARREAEKFIAISFARLRLRERERYPLPLAGEAVRRGALGVKVKSIRAA